MLYGISPSPISSATMLASQIIPASLADEQRIQELEHELFALRSGRKLSPGIVRRSSEEPEVPSTSKSLPPLPVVALPPVPAAYNPLRQPKPSTPIASEAIPPPATKEPEPPIHPFSNIPETVYKPPHERNFAAKSKEAPAYHTQAPIYSPVLANEVYQRSMKAPCVTLTPEELLSISPEVRGKLREAITPKRTPNEQVTSTNLLGQDEGPSSKPIIIEDFYESYINSL